MQYSVQYTHTEEKKLPLYLRFIGINHKQEPICRPKGNHMLQWFFCIKGEGELTIDGQKSIITPGYGMMIRPRDAHAYRAVSDAWTLHIFGCEGSLLPSLMKNLNMNESGAYSFSDPHMFQRHIHQLEYLRKRSFTGKKKEYSKECYSFLLDISSCITRVPTLLTETENTILTQLIDYMEQHYAEDISLTDLSLLVNRTPEYICTYFKKHKGQTVISFLQMVRLAEAKRQLIHYPEKSIRDIAASCGFRSPSYFGKVFKNTCGLTPDQYRRADYMGY